MIRPALYAIRRGWDECQVSDEPFRWACTEPGQLLTPEYARELVRSVPTSGFRRIEAVGEERVKTYRNLSLELTSTRGQVASGLSPSWKSLIQDLRSSTYRAQVGRLLGQQVASCVEIRLVRHRGGDWISPHTDRDDKLFSHIIYINPHWSSEWGGDLQLLSDNTGDHVAVSIAPVLGTSVIFARSDTSWHQVSKVKNGITLDRTSILIHGLI